MPVYDFKCSHCDVVEEIFLHQSEFHLVVKCQICDREMERQMCFPKNVTVMGQSMKDAGYTPRVEVVGTGFTTPDPTIGGQKFIKSDWS